MRERYQTDHDHAAKRGARPFQESQYFKSGRRGEDEVKDDNREVGKAFLGGDG